MIYFDIFSVDLYRLDREHPILKWRIDRRRSLVLYFNYLVYVTAGENKVHEGTCIKVLQSTSVNVDSEPFE